MARGSPRMRLMKRVSALVGLVVACFAAVAASAQRLLSDCDRPGITVCPPTTPEPADIAEHQVHQAPADSNAPGTRPTDYTMTLKPIVYGYAVVDADLKHAAAQ